MTTEKNAKPGFHIGLFFFLVDEWYFFPCFFTLVGQISKYRRGNWNFYRYSGVRWIVVFALNLIPPRTQRLVYYSRVWRSTYTCRDTSEQGNSRRYTNLSRESATTLLLVERSVTYELGIVSLARTAPGETRLQRKAFCYFKSPQATRLLVTHILIHSFPSLNYRHHPRQLFLIRKNSNIYTIILALHIKNPQFSFHNTK